MDRTTLLEILREELTINLSINGQYSDCLQVELKLGDDVICSDTISLSELQQD